MLASELSDDVAQAYRYLSRLWVPRHVGDGHGLRRKLEVWKFKRPDRVGFLPAQRPSVRWLQSKSSLHVQTAQCRRDFEAEEIGVKALGFVADDIRFVVPASDRLSTVRHGARRLKRFQTF